MIEPNEAPFNKNYDMDESVKYFGNLRLGEPNTKKTMKSEQTKIHKSREFFEDIKLFSGN